MEWPFSEYLVNHKRKLVFCPIPKVACSSLKLWFFEVAGLERPPTPGLHAYVHANQRRLGLHADEECLRSPEFCRFAFTRHPMCRAVSAYVDKFLRGDISISPAAPVIEAIQRSKGHHVDREKGVTFRDFVDYLVATDNAELDPHWRPQHVFLGDVDFDFIGRFEYLQADLARIAQAVGISADIPLPHINPSSYTACARGECVAHWPAARLKDVKPHPQWEDFFDHELRDKFHARYSQDFELFNRGVLVGTA